MIFLLGIAGIAWMLLTPHGTQVNIVQATEQRLTVFACQDKILANNASTQTAQRR